MNNIITVYLYKLIENYKVDKEYKLTDIKNMPSLKNSNKQIKIPQEIEKELSMILGFTTKEEQKLINRNIDSLKILRKDKTIFKIKNVLGQYSPAFNKLYIYDQKNKFVVGHELLHFASSYYSKESGLFSGFSQNIKFGHIGMGLTEGYTTHLQDQIFGHAKTIEEINGYSYEKDIAKKLEQIIGKEKMRPLYFNADLMGLIKELNKYLETPEIIEFITSLDNSTPEKMKKSYLTLYKMNSIKQRKDIDNNLITEEQYKNNILEFSKIYPQIVYLMTGEIDVIEKEVGRKI
ncbi:MAG: hypothetical protein RSD09_05725 [Bacilli bacterium]